MEDYKITRIYTDEQGDSRFEDQVIPIKDAGKIGYLSEGVAVEKLIFRKVIEQYDYAFHNAPARQYIALMDGEIEIETSTGEIRTFKGGDVLLVEDVTGKGHRSRNLKEVVRSALFITLD